MSHSSSSTSPLSTAYLLLSSCDIDVIALVAEGTDCLSIADGLNES